MISPGCIGRRGFGCGLLIKEFKNQTFTGTDFVLHLRAFVRAFHRDAGRRVDGADCTLDLVDILTAFASGSASLVGDVAIVNLGQFKFIDEVYADKPVAAFVPGTIRILGSAPLHGAFPLGNHGGRYLGVTR